MKRKITSAIALILLVIQASAQISSLGFESWTTSPFFSPTGWYGSTVSQQTVAPHEGTRFARVVTTSATDGNLFTGSWVSSTTFVSGVPFTQKPSALNGFYKTSGLATGDSAMIVFFSLSGNPSNLVTYGSFVETTNKSTWTSFSIPLNYSGALTPDTATIFVASNAKALGYGSNAINSTIDVDDFSFSGTTGVDENTVGSSFLAFPNPATKEFTIISKNQDAVAVLMLDVSGRMIDTIPIENEKANINLDHYTNGIYFYSVIDKHKTVLFNSKLIVSK